MTDGFLRAFGKTVTIVAVPSGDNYLLGSTFKVYEGKKLVKTLDSASKLLGTMVGDYNFDYAEVLYALNTLKENNHDKAYFGVNKTLIATADTLDDQEGVSV